MKVADIGRADELVALSEIGDELRLAVQPIESAKDRVEARAVEVALDEQGRGVDTVNGVQRTPIDVALRVRPQRDTETALTPLEPAALDGNARFSTQARIDPGFIGFAEIAVAVRSDDRLESLGLRRRAKGAVAAETVPDQGGAFSVTSAWGASAAINYVDG